MNAQNAQEKIIQALANEWNRRKKHSNNQAVSKNLCRSMAQNLLVFLDDPEIENTNDVMNLLEEASNSIQENHEDPTN